LRIILTILFFTICFNSFSQQDPEFSQYNSVQTFFNPGSAGSKDKICLNVLQRQQWVGFEGAPSTSYFSADGAFSLFGADHGAGLSILNDRYGFNTDLGISLQYAFRLEIGPGKLGIGLNGGFINKALSPEWNIPDGLGDVTGDPHIPQSKESRLVFDMGTGIFYRTENLYLGISVTHLNQARIKYASATPYLVRHYYATAGYTLQLSNPAFEVLPYFVLKSDGKSNLMYLNTTVRYNKKFWGGVSYRAGDAIVGLLGAELFNGVRIGYSYDFVTSKISHYTSGSHEFTIGYCFDFSIYKSPQKYKSIRFL
jgi:type IX secretion system PorP/SprF family membrane protein